MERTTLRTMSEMKDVVIKPADKGGWLALMDKSHMIPSRLSNEAFYTKPKR